MLFSRCLTFFVVAINRAKEIGSAVKKSYTKKNINILLPIYWDCPVPGECYIFSFHIIIFTSFNPNVIIIGCNNFSKM